MDTRPPPQRPFSLAPFQALRPADSQVGGPAVRRLLGRPYRAVPERVADWRRRQRLTLDPEAALYVQEYTSAGVTVRGLVGLLDAPEATARVFPHEAVERRQVRYLAKTLEQMQLNPAPILLMHRGPEAARELLRAATRPHPDLVYTDRADQLQRIWRLTDPALLADLATALADARVVIADGHHRFEAARLLPGRTGEPRWGRALVMLVDQADTPLQLSAIHRSVADVDLALLADRSRERGYRLERGLDSHRALARLGPGVVLHDGSDWAVLEPPVGVDLVVRWLHEEVLPGWGVASRQLTFHHTAGEAIAAAGEKVAMLLPAPSFEQVDASARSGLLLPKKATSFQPKPHVGVLMRRVTD